MWCGAPLDRNYLNGGHAQLPKGSGLYERIRSEYILMKSNSSRICEGMPVMRVFLCLKLGGNHGPHQLARSLFRLE